jgi:hypothetical protein
LYEWLTTEAAQHGWREVDPTTAAGLQILVNHVRAGKPALISSTEHVAVVRPSQDPVNQVGDLLLAQAGAINTNSSPHSAIGFGTTPKYFIHD